MIVIHHLDDSRLRGFCGGDDSSAAPQKHDQFPIVDDVTGEVAEQFGIRWCAAEDANLIEAALGADFSRLPIMIGQPTLTWGPQPVEFAETMAWILPSPSGRNRSFTLEALVNAYAELRMALVRPGSARSSVGVEGIQRRRLKERQARPLDA